jgi:Holliday junction resolvase RusA-like endonuclease
MTITAGQILADVYVPGKAVTQGSVTAFVAGGRAHIRQPSTVGEYRYRIAAALTDEAPGRPPIHTGPVQVAIIVEMVRPKSHYRSGRNAHLLRDDAPLHPIGRNSGDVDKFARVALDACTDAAVWADDCQAVVVTVAKRWAEQAGLHLTVRALS